MPAVCAVGGGVLGDDEQFFHAVFHEVRRFAHDLPDGAALQAAAQVGDDAEGAFVVAAFGDFQVGVVARGEFEAGGGNEVEMRVVGRLGQVFVHRAHHRFVGLRPGDGKHGGMHGADFFRLHAEAASDNDFAVFADGFADGRERFGHGFVDEAAGVDDDEVGVVVVFADGVAVGADLREDAFGIDQRFRTAEADKADGGLVWGLVHDDGVVVKKGGDCSGFAANPLQKQSAPGSKRLGDTNVCPGCPPGEIKSGLTTAQSRK